MDESGFGLHTVVRRCWGLRGTRVVKPFQQRFDCEYLYGAVDILTGEPVFCHLPTVSCEAVWQFLGELVKTDLAAHYVVLWDGAGFHQPPEHNDPEWAQLRQVQVVKLPPCCPELEPHGEDPGSVEGRRLQSGLRRHRSAADRPAAEIESLPGTSRRPELPDRSQLAAPKSKRLLSNHPT